jgi:hypothetical protein
MNSFRYQGHVIEVVEPGTKAGQMRLVRVAVDGVLAVPFEVHEADFQRYPSAQLREQMLARQAMTLVENYGDARYLRPVYAGALPS